MSKNIPIDKIVDFAAGHLSREESLALLDEIERDEQASKELDLVSSMMNVMEQEGNALAEEHAGRFQSLALRMAAFAASLLLQLRSHPVLSGATAFTFAFAVLMILVPSSSPYGSLASMQGYDFGATVRGVDQEDFAAAVDMYREGKYDESIRVFERYIRAFPQSPLVAYAHYSAGAAYLRWSEWRLMSWFIGFDRGRVVRGMEHLQEVIRLSSNQRLLEDAHWLLAKGSLMQSQDVLAIDELRLVAQQGGERREEAAEMIRAIQQLGQRR